jgi:hypothetical protein
MPSPIRFVHAPHLRHVWPALLAALILACAWLRPVDDLAQEYVESGLKRALITFAVARSANAVISVLQETMVAAEPFGVGVSASPGQILDPLNDLVEQFSALMLAACVSFGLQRVLISVGGTPLVSWLLTAAIIGLAIAHWRGSPAPRWITKALVILLVARFAVPVIALGSEATFRLAMLGEYRQAQAYVEQTSRELTSIPAPNEPKGTVGRLERFKGWFKGKAQDFIEHLDRLKQKADDIVRNVVMLMALFLVQTLVLPIFFLWVLLRLARAVPSLASGESTRR